MPSLSSTRALKLSICITTFNRCNFIGATLESILNQLEDDCEVVVLDAASTDDTERVVSSYACQHSRLRYIRQAENNGIDQDYDRVVELARGDHCWLMTDDDLMKPGAIAVVRVALSRPLSLIIVNWEVKDSSMSRVLWPRLIDFDSDRVYRPEEMDRLFTEMGSALRYIGGIVIERATWLSSTRQSYYGSFYIHVGVIFQKPLPRNCLVIAEPLISFRHASYAAHTYSPQLFATVMIHWPSVVWSLSLPDAAKNKVCSAQPWRKFGRLLYWRAVGYYSLHEYRQYVRPRLGSIRDSLVPMLAAIFPGLLLNTLFVSYYRFSRSQPNEASELVLPALTESRFHIRNYGLFRSPR